MLRDALIHVPQPSTEPAEDTTSYSGFGFNKTVDTLNKTVLSNDVRVTVEVTFVSGMKPTVMCPPTTRSGRVSRIYGVPAHLLLQLDPSTLPQQVYSALQIYIDNECAKEAIATAARTETSTAGLDGGSLPLNIVWQTHVELLTFNHVPIHRVDRRNQRDATLPIGEQVPQGASLEAVVIMRQEVSSRDQVSITGVDALPYATMPRTDKDGYPLDFFTEPKKGSATTILRDRELWVADREASTRQRVQDASEYERKALAQARARHEAQTGGGGFFGACCSKRP